MPSHTDTPAVTLEELQAGRNRLRHVEADNHPSYESEDSERSFLKIELLERAKEFQENLRPRLEDIQQIRINHASELWLTELKGLFKEGRPLSLNESTLTPKYKLDQIVSGKPGWLELLVELKLEKSRQLRPVIWEDFYIVR